MNKCGQPMHVHSLTVGLTPNSTKMAPGGVGETVPAEVAGPVEDDEDEVELLLTELVGEEGCLLAKGLERA